MEILIAMARPHYWWLRCLLLCSLAVPLAGTAAPTDASVKAALVVNLVQFTEWPEAAGPAATKAIVCTAGKGPTVDALRALDERTFFGRTVSVTPRKRPDEAGNCHVLFLGDMGGRSHLEWVRELAGQPMLTVSDADDFAADGGIIGIVIDADRVAFEVNLSAMRKSRLVISARLLKLARAIHGRGTP